MEEYIRISAKTVEEAVIEASIELGTTSDNIEYRVLEHETKGFLGLGEKKAVIEARRKNTAEEEDIIREVFSEKNAAAKKAPAKKKQPKKPAAKKDPEKQEAEGTVPAKKEKKEPEKKEARDTEKAQARENKEVKETKEVKEAREKNKEKAREKVKEKAKEKEKAFREPADPEVAIERAEEFLDSVFGAMDMHVERNITFENDTLSIELSGDDMGVLIGKRGQTLDSLQYLTSLIVNKGKAAYVRVKVDTENYRERRKATLENLARNIAFKVKKTRKNVYLEPMNPYERRIIHSALQNDPFVTTHSEGEEPLRKVVVTLKKRDRISPDEENLFDEE